MKYTLILFILLSNMVVSQNVIDSSECVGYEILNVGDSTCQHDWVFGQVYQQDSLNYQYSSNIPLGEVRCNYVVQERICKKCLRYDRETRRLPVVGRKTVTFEDLKRKVYDSRRN